MYTHGNIVYILRRRLFCFLRFLFLEGILPENIKPNHLIFNLTLSAADSFLKTLVTKEEIAHYEQFLLLIQCFPILVLGYPFNYGDFLFFDKICSKSSAAELSYEGKG